MKSDLENLNKSFDEYWHNTGSAISPKIGEELCQYSERVARDAFIRGIQQRAEGEKAEFDFKSKMPVGSVWLGDRAFKVIDHWEKGPVLECHYEFKSLVIYRAHQIVKAAQKWKEANNGWAFDLDLYRLFKSLEAAEQDGVLQNLE